MSRPFITPKNVRITQRNSGQFNIMIEEPGRLPSIYPLKRKNAYSFTKNTQSKRAEILEQGKAFFLNQLARNPDKYRLTDHEGKKRNEVQSFEKYRLILEKLIQKEIENTGGINMLNENGKIKQSVLQDVFKKAQQRGSPHFIVYGKGGRYRKNRTYKRNSYKKNSRVLLNKF